LEKALQSDRTKLQKAAFPFGNAALAMKRASPITGEF
jgi:hypothetical protein